MEIAISTYQTYSYAINPWSLEMLDAEVNVLMEGTRTYPCGTVETFSYIDTVRVWRIETREEINLKGLTVALRRFHHVNGAYFDEFVQFAVKDPTYPVILQVFVYLKDQQGQVAPRSMWTDAERVARLEFLKR